MGSLSRVRGLLPGGSFTVQHSVDPKCHIPSVTQASGKGKEEADLPAGRADASAQVHREAEVLARQSSCRGRVKSSFGGLGGQCDVSRNHPLVPGSEGKMTAKSGRGSVSPTQAGGSGPARSAGLRGENQAETNCKNSAGKQRTKTWCLGAFSEHGVPITLDRRIPRTGPGSGSAQEHRDDDRAGRNQQRRHRKRPRDAGVLLLRGQVPESYFLSVCTLAVHEGDGLNLPGEPRP